jgi:hypothetical protein
MTAEQGDRFNLDDRDRLPWLEPADEVYQEDGPSAGKVIALVLLGLALVAAVVGGLWWIKNRTMTPDSKDPPLLSAESPVYKVPANASVGRNFEGEGDSAYPTSEGAEPDGKIDSSKVPEAPLANVSRGSMTRAQADAADAASVSRVPDGARQPDGARLVAGPVVAPVAAPKPSAPAKPAAADVAAPSGPMIQLGAYGSEKGAKDAWGKLARRFDYLAPLGNSVSPVTTGSGATLYRLRASAASAAAAAELCGRLRVAGEECRVVN